MGQLIWAAALLQGYILVVDDQPQWCEVLKDYLKDEGYYVEVANSKEEAVECLQGRPYDLVITNLHLRPPISGISLHPQSDYQGVRVVEAVHKYARGTPCVVISTRPHGLKQHLDRFAEWKADMNKADLPLTELASTVRTVIADSRNAAQSRLRMGDSRAGKIFQQLIQDPIAGITQLIEAVEHIPEWKSKRASLGMRLHTLNSIEQTLQSITRLTDTQEAERREAIHFAMGVCFQLEEVDRANQGESS
jgi:CheY-like chemotaxis protein